MFLELTLFDNSTKILFNINKINSIYQIKGITNICVGEVGYQVSESYEDIVEAISKYRDLPSARR